MDRDSGDRDDRPGRLEPTSLAVLAGWSVAALAAGWLLHPVSDRVGTPPVVTWTQPVLLFIVAAVLAAGAWSTWRVVHVRHERLQPHQALNRLVMARASAYVGAVVTGGYVGYALSWIGDAAELADQRLGRSLVAAVAGLLIVVSGLLLERACRVRKDR